MKKSKPVIIGISGYLGSGKSTALKFIGDSGIDAVDADRVVHDLYEPGKDGWRKINDFFGDEYITKKGTIDRKKLGKAVFSNPAKLHILEKLMHPLVYNEINKIIQKCNCKYLALEAVKFDNGRLDAPVKYIIWISSDKVTGYKRFTKKRKIPYKEYLQILKYQKKPAKIDFIVKNDGSKTDLKKKVAEVVKKLVN